MNSSYDKDKGAVKGEGKGKGQRKNSSCPIEVELANRKFDNAWDILEDMDAKNIKADKFTVSKCLMKVLNLKGNEFLKRNKLQRCIRIVKNYIIKYKEDADEVLFNSHLDACSYIKDCGELDFAISKMKEYDISQSDVTLGILVKAYGNIGDLAQVLDVWDNHKTSNGSINHIAWGCMISACINCKNIDKAYEIFNDMKLKEDISKNTVIYTTLIKGFGIFKNLDKCLELFKEMIDIKVPLNTICFNSVLDACIRCDNMAKAQEIYTNYMLATVDVKPDIITYSTLIKGFCQQNDIESALGLLEEIAKENLEPDELVYNTLFDGCVRVGDLTTGVGLFEAMLGRVQQKLRTKGTGKQNGKGKGKRPQIIYPSSITIAILIRLFKKHNQNETDHDAIDHIRHIYDIYGLPFESHLLKNGHGDGKGKGKWKSSINSQQNYENRNYHAQFDVKGYKFYDNTHTYKNYYKGSNKRYNHNQDNDWYHRYKSNPRYKNNYHSYFSNDWAATNTEWQSWTTADTEHSWMNLQIQQQQQQQQQFFTDPASPASAQVTDTSLRLPSSLLGNTDDTNHDRHGLNTIINRPPNFADLTPVNLSLHSLNQKLLTKTSSTKTIGTMDNNPLNFVNQSFMVPQLQKSLTFSLDKTPMGNQTLERSDSLMSNMVQSITNQSNIGQNNFMLQTPTNSNVNLSNLFEARNSVIQSLKQNINFAAPVTPAHRKSLDITNSQINF